MPLTWIHDPPKQRLEDLASQLGVPQDGTLDELRKRVKDKWAIVQTYLPPSSTAKSIQATNPNQSVMNSVTYASTPQNKIRLKIVSELLSAIPQLSGIDPEQIIQFLIRVNQVLELKLLPGSEIMPLLITRTSGRLLQIIGAHIGTTNEWGAVQSQSIAAFLPPRMKEQFLVTYVLE
jgi:hypothetical protein